MKEWYESLDQRERLMVGIAAVVVAIGLFMMAIWHPLSSRQADLQGQLDEARDLMSYVQQAAATAKTAGGGRRGPRQQGRERSLLSLVDETTRQRGLKEAVKRIQPEGESTVRIWLEQAPFDDVVRWLDELNQRYGIQLSNGNLDREEKVGTIKARLTLERS